MRQTLENSPIFEDLSDPILDEISQRVETFEMSPRDVLFEQGEPGEELYSIVEGLLKITLPDPMGGREKTLAMLGDGEIVGEMAALGDQDRSGKAEAVRETTLIKIDRDTFLDLLREYPQIGLNLIRVLSRRLMMSDLEIQNVTFKNLPGRIAGHLIKLADSFGHETAQGVRIDLPITHQQLAELVGTNRETVTRHISTFKKEGSIATEDQKIVIIDQERLETWM